jgi:DNA polymerase elongation subunit (family B)
MGVHYGDLTSGVVEWVHQNRCNSRVISLDLETKVLDAQQFLTGERILSAALASRIDGEIEEHLYVLNNDDDDSEADLLARFDEYFRERRPLVLLGYNVTGYDLPLINMKLRNVPRPLWGLRDCVERCYALDLKHVVRFEISRGTGEPPRILPMAVIESHSRFSHLPLLRTKQMLNDMEDKGVEIFRLWKEDRKKFELYAKGDAHDVLLLYEELFPG